MTPPTVCTKLCPWAGQQQNFKDWLLPRVLELTYTAWDLEPFARDVLEGVASGEEGFPVYWRLYFTHSPLATGHSPPLFRWNEERRFLLRCELDAAFFHLYGITRDDAAYIMAEAKVARVSAWLHAAGVPSNMLHAIFGNFRIETE